MSSGPCLSRIYAGSILFAALLFALTIGCSENPVADDGIPGGTQPPPPPTSLPDSAVVGVRLASWNDLTGHGAAIEAPATVAEIQFEISAPDIPTHTRTVGASQAIVEEVFTIKTGAARRIAVEAFNAADSLLYQGVKYVDLIDSALVTGVGMVSASDGSPPVYAGAESAVALTANHAQISWQLATDGADPDYEALYLVYVSTVSGVFDYSSPSVLSAPGETSCLLAGLDASTTYYVVVRSMDRAGNIDANTAQQSLITSPASGELYVDVATGTDNGTCGTSSAPCKTITYALSRTAGNQTIHVASGTYNAAQGEVFPLQLKPGTTLAGDGFWWMGVKVIQKTYIEGTTPVVLGADNASLLSCYFRPTDWGSSLRTIDDDGHAITVYHCTVDGTLFPSGLGVSFSAGSSLIDSRVENFTGGGGRAVGISGAGGVTVRGNVIKNHWGGIAVGASNSTVSGCVIDNIYGTGIGVNAVSSVLHNVLVFRNAVSNTSTGGIALSNTTDTEVIYNSISHTRGYGLSINQQQSTHMLKVHNNSITHGSTAAIWMTGGQAIITDNTIVCNVAGIVLRSDQVVDLRWNAWDHDPPSISPGRGFSDPGCDGFYDICYERDYAGTPEPLYQPDGGRGSCIVGVVPSPPRPPPAPQ